MPGTVLGAGDTTVNEIDTVPCPQGAYSLVVLQTSTQAITMRCGEYWDG